MKNSNDNIKQLSLFAITWPIFIEVFLQTFLNIADVFMLSFVSDEAVASIGVVTQIMMFAFVLFNFTAMGAGVVIAQYIGARRPKDASLTIGNAVFLNLLFGIFISAVIVFLRHPILRLFNLEADLYAYAEIYLIIVGGTLFTQALILTIFSVLQAKGMTKDVMYVSLGMNILNIFGNYVFIFGAFGAPELGVTGVAIATAVSRTIAMIVLIKMLGSRIDVKVKLKEFFTFKKEYVKKIMKIGVPSAGEHLSYNLSQITITVFITLLGASALATRVYTMNILNFMVIFSMAMSKGMQIYIGQLVGAGKMEYAYKEMFRGLKWALGVTMVCAILIAITGEQLFSIFTSDMNIIALGTTLLIVGIILEPGRASNLVIISALRASGDAQFPVLMGIIVMWGVSVPLSYFLGIHLGYGLIGVWIALLLDEWIRAIIMYFRWRSKVWQKKALVKPSDEIVEDAPVKAVE
ncbi:MULTISPECIES: MATE family efflux transporter [Bacillaceae]|uniref:MATE family efflux transporter n=1 Tax=Evansella alkalicola TaxID=745819 RepID=A0ABS6JYB7_9BACI|nr:MULTISPECIES: MATE family efflux transporter [Bacillaceae]MBU9722202.1 MATE family efflux transporter [Bacillus alkalicola]